MRTLMFIVLVLALWAGLKHFGIGPGPSKADLAAGKLHSEGFLEARVRFSANGKTIDMVVVEEKPPLADCQDSARQQSLTAACPAGLKCEVVQFGCTSTVDARYVKLLARQPTHLAYTHAAIKDAGPPRSMASVVWGLTVEESTAFCQRMVATSELAKKEGLTLSCVAARS
jgi:hypothetical protein